MKSLKLITGGILAVSMSMSVNATILSFTGDFNNDETRFYADFDVTAASVVDLTSFGYAGGTNGAGDTIVDGGFDSQLFLFDSNGTSLFSDDDSSSIVSASSGNAWDAFLSVSLAVGSYTAVLTQFNSDYQSGDLHTGIWSLAGTSGFVDNDSNIRSSAYAFDISGDHITNVVAATTNVPEPASLALLGLGLAGIGFSRRKK